jgi:hypothetical protein
VPRTPGGKYMTTICEIADEVEYRSERERSSEAVP